VAWGPRLSGLLQAQHPNAKLDAVRGISALVVVCDHISSTFYWRLVGHDSLLATVATIAGRHAVILFFLLSGHLITKSIASNTRHGGFSASDYAAARIARIYPPLIGAIAVCGIVWAIIHGLQLPGSIVYGLPHDLYRDPDSYVMTGTDVLGAISMRGGLTDADAPLWSLFIEVHIYVLAMAVASFWQRKWLVRVACIIAGLAAVFLLRYQAFWIAMWVIGASTVFLKAPRRYAIIIAAFAAICVAIGVAKWGPSELGSNTAHGYMLQLSCAVLYAVGLFYVFPKLHYPRVIVGTANFSYSVYIIHAPLLLLALSLTQDWMGYSFERTSIVVVGAGVAIIAFVIPFAWFLERPKQFKVWILRGLPYAKAVSSQ